MPVNKNALIRYRTIDQCLCNRGRKWTLNNLIEACSDALYEYEGIRKTVSKRTIQGDIQMMRSDKLGYNAPIVVVEKKYYIYEDIDYSISSSPLSEGDLSRLSEVVDILKQFKGFSAFKDLEGMVKKLEDKIEVAQFNRNPIIDFDRNEQLQGLEYLDAIYQAILEKKVMKFVYKPFWKEEATTIILHPYLLKEFRNRWYVVGFNHEHRKIAVLALDRIQQLDTTQLVRFIENNFFNPTQYFKDVIGMTVNLGKPAKEVLLYIYPVKAPYILTKPLHPSQKLVSEYKGGAIISLQVQINYELKDIVMSMGSQALVLSPGKFRQRIEDDLSVAAENYSDKKLRGEIWQFLNG